ncbi:hypothetical protein CKO18_13660 [Rhodoferax fermentans]|nr:hypothetical protein [Rhodoferax fermentans]
MIRKEKSFMSHRYDASATGATGSFSRKIAVVLALVLAVALLGSSIGFWSLQRVSGDTERMVGEVMATERLAADLQRHILVNVARTKGLALSSEPQVGDALMPEIKQTADQVAALLAQLGDKLTVPEDQATLARMQAANSRFAKSLQDLIAARDGGVTAKIEQAYTEQFTPAANELQAAVKQLGDAQRAKIDTSAQGIAGLSLNARWGLVVFSVCALLLSAVLSVWLIRSIKTPIQLAVDTADRVASLDLTHHFDGHNRDEAGRLLIALSRMQTSLHSLVHQVQTASHSVAQGSTEIAAGNLDLSSRIETAASYLQQTAASIEDVVANMHSSLEAASRGDALAKSASLEATQGSAVMTEVMQTMQDIHTSSSQIVEIISVIDGIAFQTNILALNAAVEAARAGEQGRGFAVVAAEVRTLANRSAVAAREIKSLIGSSASKIELGTQKAQQALDTMVHMVDSVKRVSAVIGEIHAGSLALSGTMTNINQAVTQLDSLTQQNAAVVEESAAAAQNLQDQAAGLRDVAAQFRLPNSALLLT